MADARRASVSRPVFGRVMTAGTVCPQPSVTEALTARLGELARTR